MKMAETCLKTAAGFRITGIQLSKDQDKCLNYNLVGGRQYLDQGDSSNLLKTVGAMNFCFR